MTGSIIHRFRKDERGANAVEFALLMPVLLLLLLGSVALFDLFRTWQSVEKATFTVGDMMSRQMVMSQAELDSMLVLMRQIVPGAIEGGIRVSSISRNGERLVVNWTRSAGVNVPSTPLPTEALPNIADGDSVLLTESFVPHRRLADIVGLGEFEFKVQAAHRPRFVSAIAFR